MLMSYKPYFTPKDITANSFTKIKYSYLSRYNTKYVCALKECIQILKNQAAVEKKKKTNLEFCVLLVLEYRGKGRIYIYIYHLNSIRHQAELTAPFRVFQVPISAHQGRPYSSSQSKTT